MSQTPDFTLEGNVFDDDITEGNLENPYVVAESAWAQVQRWVANGYRPVITVTTEDGVTTKVDLEETVVDEKGTCRHCGRVLHHSKAEGWYCPEATGDDTIWRQSCEDHDTFTAEHEPEEEAGPSSLSLVNGLRADLHEPDCPGMDEDGNWLGPCDCAATSDNLPTCKECGEKIEAGDVHSGYGMCGSCLHNAERSGWTPTEEDS